MSEKSFRLYCHIPRYCNSGWAVLRQFSFHVVNLVVTPVKAVGSGDLCVKEPLFYHFHSYHRNGQHSEEDNKGKIVLSTKVVDQAGPSRNI